MLLGIAIERQGWSAAFFWLGAVWGDYGRIFLVPLPAQSQPNWAGPRRQPVRRLARGAAAPVIWAAMGYGVLNMAGNETIFLVFGDWMSRSWA